MSTGKLIIFNIAAILILASMTTINCEDATPIPADKSQVASWFAENVKPLDARKATLNATLVAAEANATTIKVRKDGSGDFKTITDAIKSIPEGNTRRVLVVVGPGTYVEKVTIDRARPFVSLIGDSAGPNMPVLSFNGDAKTYGTVFSATIQIEAEYFVCANMVIKNTAPPPDGKREGAQAVALRVAADKAAFYNCRFFGYQDTVCDDDGHHFYKDCFIAGNIDFIFGDGQTIFLNTEINVLESHNGMRIIVAHGKQKKEGTTGYSFVHCSITGPGTNATLGRAWFDASETVFAYTEMSNVVSAEGWSDNLHPERQATVFFGEYKNTGPMADTKGRVKFAKQLTDEQAKKYISLGFIEGSSWLLPPPKV